MRVLTRPLVVLLIAVAGCTSNEADVAADEAAIRQVDRDMVAAGNAHDIDAWLAFIADDARMLPPGAPPVVGKDAIRDLVNAFMSAGGDSKWLISTTKRLGSVGSMSSQ